MGKTSTRAFNKTFLIFSIITFVISFYPNIEEIWKVILLITALGLLITTYFLSYSGSIDKTEEEINNIIKRLNLNEKVLNSLTNIKLINNTNKILKNQNE